MSRREKVLDDLARAAGETVGFVHSLKSQAKTSVKSRIDSIAQDLDLVPREDFERVELMLVKARQEQESLLKRIEALEATVFSNKKK